MRADCRLREKQGSECSTERSIVMQLDKARPILCIVISAGAWAQGISTSAINGAIHDPTGAGVPNAQIAATQTATGASRSAISGPAGRYIFPELPVGPYEMKVTKPGFTAYAQTRLA